MGLPAVNAHQDRLLARLVRLRARGWAVLSADTAGYFSRNAARGWKERGFSGLASACWDLQQEAAEVVGAYDVFAEARSLAGEFAAQTKGA